MYFPINNISLGWSATYTAAEHLARAKEIHTIINGIRTNPSAFVPKLEAKKVGWSGNEGVEVVGYIIYIYIYIFLGTRSD